MPTSTSGRPIPRLEIRRSSPAWLDFLFQRPRMTAVTLGLVLTAPSLGAGWILDDYHILFRLSRPSPALPFCRQPLWDLFRFADGNPEHTQSLMEIGFWPWWTSPTLRAGFFRPMTAASHLLDRALFPNSAVAAHVQNLLWYALTIALVGTLYQRLGGSAPWTALAVLFFAVDDLHLHPAAWIANRNSLLAAVFGLGALLNHFRWRETGRTTDALFAMLLLLAALLSKEEGLAACGYLLAYALVVDRASFRKRILTMLPYLVVVMAWRIVWSAKGYGFSPGLPIYVDPLHEPFRFIGFMIEGIPTMFVGLLLAPVADLYTVTKIFGYHVGVWWVATFVLVAIARPVLRTVIRRRDARFLALGMIFSLIPLCAAQPSGRLAMIPSIGSAALLAICLNSEGSWSGSGRSIARKAPVDGPRSWHRLMWAAHAILSPVILLLMSGCPLGPADLVRSCFIRFPDGMDLSGKTVVAMTAPIPLATGFLAESQAVEGLSIPGHTYVLGLTPWQTATIHRPNDRSLLVRSRDGLLSGPLSSLCRLGGEPLQRNQRIVLPSMTVEILDVSADGQPTEVAFVFDCSLESPDLIWVLYHRYGFKLVGPPAMGETMMTPRHEPGPG